MSAPRASVARFALLIAATALLLLTTSSPARAGEYWFAGYQSGGYGSYGVATAPPGDYVVANRATSEVQRYTTGGSLVDSWGSFGTGDGQFQNLWGIATDPTGAVYVADTGNNRIQKFTASGTFVTKWGSIGTGNGQFNRPVHVDVDAAGFVYVTDSNNNRVQKFDSAGNFVTKWGTPGTGDGQFSTPHGLAVGPGGVVYVGDSGARRIQKFDSNGNFLTKWGTAGTAPGQFAGDIWGLDTDAGGDVFATVALLSAGCTMNKFSSTGVLLDSICNRPSSRGLDVADQADGSLLIPEEGNEGLARYARGARLTIRMTSADGGTATFAVGGGLSPASVTLAHNQEQVYLPPAGTYSVSASSATLLQTGASCSDGSDPANVSLTAGEDVICNYGFERKPQIVVVQDSQPNDPQDFTFNTGGGLSLATFQLDDDGGINPLQQSQTLYAVPGSGYSVSQSTPSGWNPPTTTCSDGSPVTNIALSSREIVTCTFKNRKIGSGEVVLRLDSQPDSATTFDFKGLPPATIQLNDDGSGTPGIPNEAGTYVNPGTYSVVEDYVAGWNLSSASCSDGSPVWAVNVSADETVTCTFTNQQTPTGTVLVQKHTDAGLEYANETLHFDFTAGGGLNTPQYPADFTLTVDEDSDFTGNNRRRFQVPVGSGYSIEEDVPEGWVLASSTCSDGSSFSNITVSAGESITCTLLNRLETSITIVQDTQPDGPQDFTYQATGPGLPSSFTLDDDGDEGNGLPSERVFDELAAGSYSIIQAADPAWNRFFAYCDDRSSPSNITLDVGEHVTCHFGNTPQGEPQPATSFGAGGVVANGEDFSVSAPKISGNGSFVVFESTATNLSVADSTTGRDIYLRNVRTGEVRLVSRATGVSGAVGNSASTGPSVSADGRYVAFASSATNFDPADTSFLSDVYVRDVAANITTLVSRATGAGGAKGNSDSFGSISPNGRYVAFTSQSTNLDLADTDSLNDVYVRDLQTATTTLVSRATGVGGSKGNGGSSGAAVSDSGRVAFRSTATNLDPADSDAGSDVFVRDTQAGTTTLASRASGVAGAKGNFESGSSGVRLSGNGRYVAFGSSATNLSPDDTFATASVFVRDLDSNTTELISRSDGVSGPTAGTGSSLAGLTSDGRHVSFSSGSTLDPAIRLPEDDCGCSFGFSPFTYLRDRQAGTTRLLSATTGRKGMAAYNSAAGTTSDDGRYTAFSSSTSFLSPDASWNRVDVYVRDAQTHVTSLESRASPVYARSKAATPFFAQFVPAYQACGSSNRQHVAPLSFASCAPPAAASPRLTAGTPDANGSAANLIASLKLSSVTESLPLNPNNGDQSDVGVEASITDVRNATGLTDYTGELELRLPLRLTDRVNFPATGGMGPGTTQGFDLSASIPCTATASATIGGSCTFATTLEAIVPGAVIENSRGIWQLGAVEVYDGGPDSDADTQSGNTPFLRQGIFVP